MRRNVSDTKLTTSKSALLLSELEGGGDSEVHGIGIRVHRQNLRTVKTRSGITAYSAFGPPLENSRGLVVCIHGLTLASYVFTDIAVCLAKQRWHVLTYDIYGRGRSTARAGAVFNDGFYVRQLKDLLRALDLWDLPDKTKLNIIGSSLGGGIAIAFCAKFPGKCRKLVTIAPVGLMSPSALPLVARLSFSLGCFGAIVQKFLETCCSSCTEQYLLDAFALSRWSEFISEDVSRTDFVSGYWNTLKNFPMCELSHEYRLVSNTSKCDVLVIWGEDDAIVPFSTCAKVQEHIPRAKVITWPDVGHEITVGEGGKLVSSWLNNAIGDFL